MFTMGEHWPNSQEMAPKEEIEGKIDKDWKKTSKTSTQDVQGWDLNLIKSLNKTQYGDGKTDTILEVN